MRRRSLAPLAKADLDSIWLYVASKASPETADRVVDSIADCFELLTQMPKAGRLREDIAPDLRSFAAGDYLIYYRIEPRVVKISRILHGKRNQSQAWNI